MNLFFLFICISATTAQFKFAYKRELGSRACVQLINPLTDSVTLLKYVDSSKYCLVSDQPRLGSVAKCLKDGGFSDPEMYIEAFLKQCSFAHLTRSQFESAYNNATNYLVPPNTYKPPSSNHKRSNDLEKRATAYQAAAPFPYPVVFKPEVIQKHFIQLYKSEQAMNWEIFFGIALVGYWFVVMIIAAIYNWSRFLRPLAKKSTNGQLANWVKRNISLAPLGSHYHAAPLKWPLGGLIPTRFETIVLSGWFILLFAFCFPQVHTPVQSRFINAVANRFSNIGVFNLPLLVLFAGRNNFLQWFTGWGYSRFLTFHRWIARVTFIMILLHAICETVYMKDVHAYGTLGKQPAIVMGYVGMVAMALIMFQSLYFLRSHHYEVFLLVHIILAAIFIAGGWRHCHQRGGVELFYASVACWVLDRVVRLARLCSFGIQEALVEIKADETLKVTVNRPKYWKPFPGCHAFIHFIRPSCFWQSHPFTLVDSVSEPNTISFYIKIKGGISHGLYRRIMQEPSKTLRLKVTVEGPYSLRTPIYKYENAVFLTGGNGIPGLYYEAYDMATKSVDKQIKLYWIIRNFKSIEWFLEELQRFETTNVQVVVYVTRPDECDVTTESDSGDSQHSRLTEKESRNSDAKYLRRYHDILPHVQFRYGRPNIGEIVRQSIQEADNSVGFATCAHPAMVDDVRKHIRDNLRGKTHKRIELFEQIQGW